jgi:UDP-N-acetylmuramate--alanine ligase
VPFEQIAAALAEFGGAERRFQRLGEARGVMVVDDYGHHPTEIAAVIAAARAGIGRRVMVVFQPHRYSRTRDLMDEFGPALGGADEIVLTDIYAASEPPLPGVTLDSFAARVKAASDAPVYTVPAVNDLPAFVAGRARPGDLVITLGAGSIGGIGPKILDALGQGPVPGRVEEAR